MFVIVALGKLCAERGDLGLIFFVCGVVAEKIGRESRFCEEIVEVLELG